MLRASKFVCSAALLGLASISTAQTIPTDLIFRSGLDHPAEGPYTPEEASRFLQQATFGPKIADIENLLRIGYNAWFDQQFAATRSEHLPYIVNLLNSSQDVFQERRVEIWWKNLLTNNDQLRQKTAYALSQIFVTSDQSGAVEGIPTTLADYYDLLSRNAFGNYRTLLGEVTLHPSMGRYLSMHKNEKPNAATNTKPDENYAREIMQLFSVGLVMLNSNGTPVSPSTPTYTQDTIRGFAHVFTGWNYSTCEQPNNAGETWKWIYCSPRAQSAPQNQDYRLHIGWMQPMRPWAEGTAFESLYHSSQEGPPINPANPIAAGAKQLLRYPGVSLANGVLPQGGTARSNMNAALDNVAAHPNVGPFISRLLIQRFVSSNPSPAYIGRMTAVFNNNGSGVRGDMRALIKAILMDPEARRPTAQNRGKVREPLVRLTHMFRVFDAASRNERINEYTEYWMAQAPMRSPTVFNFYLPDYRLPGEITTLNLFSPEFQITTDTYITRIINEMWGKVAWQYQGNPGLPPINEWNPTLVNINRDLALANNAEVLVHRYNLLFMGGTMSTAMSNLLVAHVRDMPNNNDDDRRRRIQDVVWLIMNSPEYIVEK
jgi:uncharacterized protein (DUF1800 family)